MKLRFIECAGFRGVLGRLRIDVPDGFLVLSGRNGAGKSTCCDAVEYALSGTISRLNAASEGNEPGSMYAWWRGEQQASDKVVRVGFGERDASDLVIERRPETPMSPSEAEVFDRLCFRDLAPSQPLKELCRTLLIRGDEIIPSSVDLSERDRGEFIARVLGTSRWTLLRATLDGVERHAKDAQGEAQRAYTRQLERQEQAIARRAAMAASAPADQQLGQARAFVASIVGETQGSVDLLVKRGYDAFHAGRARLLELRQLIEQAERVIAGESALADEQGRALGGRLEAARQALQTCVARRVEVEAELAAFERESAGHRSLAELALHGERLGVPDATCPLCGSQVLEHDFARHIEEIRRRIGEAGKRTERAASERAELAGAEQRLRSEIAALDALAQQRARLAGDVESGRTGVLKRASALGIVDAEIGSIPELASSSARRLEAQSVALGESLSILGMSVQRPELEAAENEVGMLGKETVVAEAALRRSEELSSQVSGAQRVVKRLEAESAKRRLAELSPLFAELYARLRPHPEWRAGEYKIRGEVQQLVRMTVEGNRSPRFMFSTGQRRALGLAFLLTAALARSWTRVRTVILDDPVQHVDDYRALNLVETLAGLVRSGIQVVCAVEDPDLGHFIARRIGASSPGGGGAHVQLEYEVGAGVKARETFRVVEGAAARVLSGT